MTIREAILARLSAIGWTPADLGRAANIPKQNLYPILRGSRPLTARHLFVIDAVLNLGLDLNRCTMEGE